MFWPFKKKNLEDHLSKTRKVKVHGMIFHIKRINVLDHCTGAKVCSAVYDTYKIGNQQSIDEASMVKVKSYYTDILMAGIVKPEFSRKTDEKGKIFIDHLFTDWDLASELYGEIMAFSYGKKNFAQLTSQGKS